VNPALAGVDGFLKAARGVKTLVANDAWEGGGLGSCSLPGLIDFGVSGTQREASCSMVEFSVCSTSAVDVPVMSTSLPFSPSTSLSSGASVRLRPFCRTSLTKAPFFLCCSRAKRVSFRGSVAGFFRIELRSRC
jgi:hypothetical protein